MKASIIIPTRNRAKALEGRLNTLVDNTPEFKEEDNAELIFAIDDDDVQTYKMLEGFIRCDFNVSENRPLELPCKKWNNACKIAKGEWLVTISDDCLPEKRWLTNALNTNNNGFIGLPDGVTGDRNKFFTPLYMMTREWAKKYHGGVLVIPWYKSWYADIETAFRARKAGHYMYAPNSVVTQLHAVFGTADNDDIYKLGESRRAMDRIMFESRQRKNFPDDFEGVL